MKKTLLLSALTAVFIISSCGGKKEKTRQQEVAEFRSSLNSEDTTTVLRLCDEAMETLKQKDIEKVLGSLYEYNDSTKEVKALTEETAKKYRRRFQMFPVIEYRRLYYSIQLEGCNDVKYSVVFATAEQAGTEKPAQTSFMFNPVKVDGTWKLCVKTEKDEIDPTIK